MTKIAATIEQTIRKILNIAFLFAHSRTVFSVENFPLEPPFRSFFSENFFAASFSRENFSSDGFIIAKKEETGNRFLPFKTGEGKVAKKQRPKKAGLRRAVKGRLAKAKALKSHSAAAEFRGRASKEKSKRKEKTRKKFSKQLTFRFRCAIIVELSQGSGQRMSKTTKNAEKSEKTERKCGNSLDKAKSFVIYFASCRKGAGKKPESRKRVFKKSEKTFEKRLTKKYRLWYDY